MNLPVPPDTASIGFFLLAGGVTLLVLCVLAFFIERGVAAAYRRYELEDWK